MTTLSRAITQLQTPRGDVLETEKATFLLETKPHAQNGEETRIRDEYSTEGLNAFHGPIRGYPFGRTGVIKVQQPNDPSRKNTGVLVEPENQKTAGQKRIDRLLGSDN